MKVAIIGDAFVSAPLIADKFLQFVKPRVEELTLTSQEVDWPATPLMHNYEVKEFVGDPDAVANFVQDVDAIVTHVAPITRSVIDGAPHLRIIGCCRGGPVNINVA